MSTKERTNVQPKRKVELDVDATEDPTASIISGDFTELPREIEAAIGAVVRVCVRRGGYFGLSVTDDGGSAKLTVRTKRITVERRFYKFTDLSAAIAAVFTRLRDI